MVQIRINVGLYLCRGLAVKPIHLLEHCVTRIIAKSFVFLNRRLTTGDTAAELLKSLRKLAETCDLAPSMTRHCVMFVIGMNDRDTQERLLGEKNLAYKKAFHQAQSA